MKPVSDRVRSALRRAADMHPDHRVPDMIVLSPEALTALRDENPPELRADDSGFYWCGSTVALRGPASGGGYVVYVGYRA